MENTKWWVGYAVALVVMAVATYFATAVSVIGTTDLAYPTCAAFSGKCDPGMVWRFSVYASIALMGIAGSLVCLGKTPSTRPWPR
jgi:hypothetical protein